jgi:hypothetical protein
MIEFSVAGVIVPSTLYPRAFKPNVFELEKEKGL